MIVILSSDDVNGKPGKECADKYRYWFCFKTHLLSPDEKILFLHLIGADIVKISCNLK